MRTVPAFLHSSLIWLSRPVPACTTCYGTVDAVQDRITDIVYDTLLRVVAVALGLLAAFRETIEIPTERMAMNSSATLEIGQTQTGLLIEVNIHG